MTALDTLAERVSRGAVLTDAEAAEVAASPDLIAIGMMADDVRRRLHGSITTFARVFEMHVETPLASLPPRVSAGELRIVGAPASLDAACAAVAAARRLAPDAPLSGFSLPEIAALDVTDAYGALRAAGLDRVASAPVEWDPIASAATRARDAGLIVDRLVVGSPEGSGIPLIARARELQHALGGFRAFAPLPRVAPDAAPTTGYDDVKMVALARLMLGGIASIQVDWSLYGPKLAQVALTVGADDLDAVPAVEPGTLGPRRSVLEEVKANIVAAGFEPVERDGAFRTRVL